MRCIGWPQPHVVSAGSWRYSRRGRLAGNLSLLGCCLSPVLHEACSCSISAATAGRCREPLPAGSSAWGCMPRSWLRARSNASSSVSSSSSGSTDLDTVTEDTKNELTRAGHSAAKMPHPSTGKDGFSVPRVARRSIRHESHRQAECGRVPVVLISVPLFSAATPKEVLGSGRPIVPRARYGPIPPDEKGHSDPL